MADWWEKDPTWSGETKKENPPWLNQDQLDQPTGQEKLNTFVGSAGGAMAQSGMTMAGLYMGAEVGSLAGPVGTAVGGTLGFGLGYFAGDELRNFLSQYGLALPSPEHIPEKTRPYAYAGEFIGGGLPMSMGTIGLAKAGARFPATKVGNYVNRILDYAAAHPHEVLAAEAGTLATAGIAGGAAEAYYPGKPLVRLPAEIVAGTFNPARIARHASNLGVWGVSRIMMSMSQSARQQAAGQLMQKLIREAGEDPLQVLAKLKEANIPGLEGFLTSAQKTGSQGLLLLERKLIEESRSFGEIEAKNAEASLTIMKGLIGAMRKDGSPAALQKAAELEANYYKTLIAGRVEHANLLATQAASRIGPNAPMAKSLVSQQAKALLKEAMDDSRAAETALWSKVPKDVTARAENVVLQYNRLRDELLPEEKMPAIIDGFIERMKTERDALGRFTVPQATTTGELLRFRSRLLALSREASASGKLNDARMYGTLAEASLEDLSAVKGVAEIDSARSYSRQLNEVFTQTFAGEALRKTPAGAPRIPPEMLMNRALGPGAEMGDMRFKQLQLAADFTDRARQQHLQMDPKYFQTMMFSQDNFLRLMAQDSIDIATGHISVARARTFLKKNSQLLNQFPEIKQNISEAIQTKEGLSRLETLAKGQINVIEKQSTFARLSKFASGADAIDNALKQPKPGEAMTEMIRLAKKSGKDATEGLRAAVWDDAMRKVVNPKTDVMDFKNLRNYFFKNIRPGEPNMMDLLERNGIVNSAEIANMKLVMNQAEKVIDTQKKILSPSQLEAVSTSGMYDVLVRILGAHAGTTISRITGTVLPSAGGHQLVAAYAGSRYMRRILEQVPQKNMRDILIQAAVDPKLGAMLLEKPKTQARAFELAKSINAYLIQAGLTTDYFEEQNQ